MHWSLAVSVVRTRSGSHCIGSAEIVTIFSFPPPQVIDSMQRQPTPALGQVLEWNTKGGYVASLIVFATHRDL